MAMVFALFSCNDSDDDDNNNNGEDPTTDGFRIEGTIVTDKTIAANNAIKALMEDYGADEDDDTGEILVGSSTVNNKSFSIAVDNPDAELVDFPLSELTEEFGSYITQMECENSSIKTGGIASLALTNSGTSIVGFDATMLCTDEAITVTYSSGGESITEWFIPHSIGFFYSNADFTYYKSREAPEDLDPDEVATVYELQLTQGWNLVKVDHEYTTDSGIVCSTLKSIDEVPQGYEWRLASDLFPETFNSERINNINNNNLKFK